MSSQPPTQKRACHQVSQPYALSDLIPSASSFPSRPMSPIITSSPSEGSSPAEDHGLLWTGEEFVERRQVILIDTLPDDALLEIFGHYMADFRLDEIFFRYKVIEKAWQSLVHVCRRWRSIVFGSPRRLDLQLVCTKRTPTRDRLGVWPALPLVIQCDRDTYPIRRDDIIAVLERTDRVCQIFIPNVSISDLEIFLAAMQQPFPELTYLGLWSPDEAQRESG